jgi:hypothetical protein
VINRALFVLLGFAVAVAKTQGDEPPGNTASGRLIEGAIVAAGSQPVEGAMVLFGEAANGLAFVEEATATTDAHCRFHADH